MSSVLIGQYYGRLIRVEVLLVKELIRLLAIQTCIDGTPCLTKKKAVPGAWSLDLERLSLGARSRRRGSIL